MMRTPRFLVAACGFLVPGCQPNVLPDPSVGRDLLVLNASQPQGTTIVPAEAWAKLPGPPPPLDVGLSNCGSVVLIESKSIGVGASGASDLDRTLEIEAVSAAWSNACDRLAVVVRDAAGDRVVIMTAELRTLAEIAVDLPRPDADSPYRRFAVSWSAGDELVAVSTDAIHNDNPPASGGDNVCVIPVCVFIDSRAGVVRSRQELHNAYFTGADTLVGTLPQGEVTDTEAARYHVHRVTLRDNELQDGGLVAGAGYAVGAHAESGVFVTIDDIANPLDWARLRAVDARLESGRWRRVETGYGEDKFFVAERAPVADLIPEGF